MAVDPDDTFGKEHTGIFGYPENPDEILQSPAKEEEFYEMMRAKKVQEAKDALQRLRILDEVIPQIVWTADPDGYQDYFNKRWFEYTGFTPTETYAGKTALHPDDFQKYVDHWTLAIKTGESYETEYRFRRAIDGMYRWHLVRGGPIRDEQGAIVKWLGTFTDIHDLKQAQEDVRKLNAELENRVQERTRELERSNTQLALQIDRGRVMEEKDRANLQRLSNVIGIMPMGTVITDESGVILNINEQFCQLFQLDDHPLTWTGQLSEKLLDAVAPRMQDATQYRTVVVGLMQKLEPAFRIELPLLSSKIFLLDYLPIIENGKARGHLFLYRDITKERRIDAAKSEFMSLASHQLRTPLTSIRWALGRLSKRMELLDAKDSMLDSARKSAAHMAETIDTMLSISRIESEEFPLQYSDVSLQNFLSELIARYEEDCRKKYLTLTLECEDIHFEVDRKVLEEIVQNLLVNAIKYTPAGGNILIRGFQESDSVLLQVEDTGLGIPQSQQNRVFSKFFRADNVLQVVTEGTGLGLYLTFSLTRLLDGTISFQSEEGKGTIFSLTLPHTQKQTNKK